jgi:hypothetical protein
MAMDAVGLVIQGYRNRRQQSCVVPCNHSKKAPQNKLQLSKEQSSAALRRTTGSNSSKNNLLLLSTEKPTNPY